jgi:PAS domain S-box-containing protein
LGADAIRAEFAFDSQPDDLVAPAPNGMPPAGQASPWTVPAPAPAAAPAPPRPELPDVAPGQAAALISLDGRFTRLDDAFCSLLGCREEDLRAARWPSIIDRENLKPHQEIARALKAGEIRSAEIETVYMHAQGLLVPIAGTIALHRDDPAGDPTHFLFRADVSRTAGVPGSM